MLLSNHDMFVLHGVSHQLSIQLYPLHLLWLCPEVKNQGLWLLRLETDLHISLHRLLPFRRNREKELIVDCAEMRFPKLC